MCHFSFLSRALNLPAIPPPCSVKSCFQNMEICKRRTSYDTGKSLYSTSAVPSAAAGNLTVTFSSQLNQHNQVPISPSISLSVGHFQCIVLSFSHTTWSSHLMTLERQCHVSHVENTHRHFIYGKCLTSSKIFIYSCRSFWNGTLICLSSAYNAGM